MAYTRKEAEEKILEAGRKLLEKGLVSRTWGNISARLSQTQFLITPSGRAYETMRPEELVAVNIADCSFSGSVRPSSEKGIHADVYRLRPEADFVIHTHQFYASAVGVTGKDLPATDPVLGGKIPCAAYGMPGSDVLRRYVAEAAEKFPQSCAFLMMRHGALCIGESFEHAFALTDALEAACKKEFDRLVLLSEYPAQTLPCRKAESAPFEISCCDRFIWEAGRRFRSIVPYLDDLAQIAGAEIAVCGADEAQLAGDAQAVLIRDCGALCRGKKEADAQAVAQILSKGCAAQLYADCAGGAEPLSREDAQEQREDYLTSYSKRKDDKGQA